MDERSRKVVWYVVIIITSLMIGLPNTVLSQMRLNAEIQENIEQRYVMKWHPYADITLSDMGEGISVDCKAGQGYWLEFQDSLKKPMVVQPGSIQVSIRTLKQTGSIEDENGIDQTLLDHHYELLFWRNLYRVMTWIYILLVIVVSIIFRHMFKHKHTTNK
ncbi:MAG: hypothetical protein ACOX2M_03895 [Fastidiosipilaceae bacterium]